MSWPFSLTLVHSSAWKVNSPKSVCDILYNQVPIVKSAASRFLEDRDPNRTCGERIQRFALLSDPARPRWMLLVAPYPASLPTSRTLATPSGSERTMKGSPVVIIDVDRHGARGQLTSFGLHLLHVGIGTCSEVR